MSLSDSLRNVSIYAAKGLSLANNPWVFAGTFKRIEDAS